MHHMHHSSDSSVYLGSLPTKLQKIFGVSFDVPSLIRQFDLGKVDITVDNPTTLTFKLAPCFGQLTEDYLVELDDRLKVIITSATTRIENLKEEERTWERVLEILEKDPVLEPLGDPQTKAERLVKTDLTWFKLSPGLGEPVVKEIRNWFTGLIGDDDVESATPIRIDELANIVAHIGMTVQGGLAMLRDQKYSKNVVDIGVLRYPDIEHPYFKLYQIKLEAWAFSSTSILTAGVRSHQNGITGTYNCRRFQPRDGVINDLEPEIKEKAVKAAEAFFAKSL